MPYPKAHKSLALFIIVGTFFFLGASAASFAAGTARQAYFEAESCYKELGDSPTKMKYRENWLRCIEKFQQVYRLDPDGP